jgi:endonuclease/exonuclease/phosphatase family metal-dependent hydrolase
MRSFFVIALFGCTPVENYLDPTGPRYAGDYTVDAPVADGDLLVVTYNLEYGREVRTAIAALRNFSSIDVLLMQEMNNAAVDEVARALAMRWVYYPGSKFDGEDFGNAVLTRWPMRADRKVLLPHRDPYYGRARIAVVAELEIDGGLAQTVSAHNTTAALGLEARLEQAEAILRDLEGRADPRVVGGDFNTADPDALDQTVALFSEYGFTWVTAGLGDTIDTSVGDFRVDHVFASGLTARESGVYGGESGSDHQPVWTRLAWP